jgi:hypothetical protein
MSEWDLEEPDDVRVTDSNGPNEYTPALLTSTSSPPNSQLLLRLQCQTPFGGAANHLTAPCGCDRSSSGNQRST